MSDVLYCQVYVLYIIFHVHFAAKELCVVHCSVSNCTVITFVRLSV